MPQKLKNIIKPESKPEKVQLVIGSDFNNKEYSGGKKTLKPSQLAIPFKSKAYRHASYIINLSILL